MMEVVVTGGATRRAKLESRLSIPIYQYSAFYRPYAIFVAQPTASRNCREKQYEYCGNQPDRPCARRG